MPSSRHPGAALLRASAVLAACALAPAALAQWNPTAGQWGKSAPGDLRVMTWNVLDTICSTNVKNNAGNNWAAVARIVAAMQPDVLILQECGDNSGNGTGSNVDSVANLAATVGMFLHGGTDTFRGGTVTQYVQAFAPGYDLPFVFVNAVTDNFNRNVVLSRHPFADRNGDGHSTQSDIPTITADLYAPGGEGGIRGYMTAEIDLPDALYAGDLVIGNSHLKAGGQSSDHTQRITAAKNIAYYIDYLWNGAGGTVPDPRGRIADSPPVTSVLGPNTMFVTGGDLNEDELTNGTDGPVTWISRAASATPSGALADGPDRNRTDLAVDQSLDLFSGSRATFGGSAFKDDYLIWQDSIGALRRSFVFDASTVTPAGAMPPQVLGFGLGAAQASAAASDHFPVIGDFVLPAPIGCNSAGQDLGFASLGSNGRFPRTAICGALAAGQSATLSLFDVPANAMAYLGFAFGRGITLVFDGTLVPLGPEVLGPVQADGNGRIDIPIGGGLGAFAVYAQWGVVDAGLPSGIVLSNALRIDFLP